jgi:hypothetical protein
VLPDFKRVAVASGDDGMCRFFRLRFARAPAGEVRGLDDADNVRFDAAARLLYVGYGDGALAVVDPEKGSVVSDIKLAAHPESFRLEENGKRVFS